MNDDENGSSFFETLVSEAVGPFFVEIADAPDIVVDVPPSDAVAELDLVTSVTAQLDILVGEDVADQILDHFDTLPASALTDLVDDIREHFGILVAPDIGWTELIGEIDKYGVDIERDLMNIPNAPRLYDWIRDHRNTPWNLLTRMLTRMPEGGWYLAAIGSDLDRAQKQLAMEADGEISSPSRRPSLVGWTSEREKQTEIVETLRRVEHGIWAASPKFKGKGGRPPKNLLRPLTARARAEELRTFADHDEIGAQVLGSRYKPILA
ncbi:hypothetical protein CH276_28040 [Rhodococcus sp. 06-470-2]|uniref:hypothetical protein n=1 Tax=unclassified Rhodococcus (in: high G+C Gram-positive bacteria) TaxID=192944 RepID=UPI000B9C5D47|nr:MULTISPECIES: hypothetical protein [unclassified Rhodococcus (in: high G+C Gram-positive bacteria)]OZC55960.1 hypothetical protein CH276_28040 [Rhodococcus sp. 06-470-2]OZE64840.1 hypothetical protein CH265_10360 [Rhodococcus sp. 05-2221-1B]